MEKPKNVDEYIASIPEEFQPGLQELRKAIRSAIPEPEERISYGIPLFYYKGRVIYFQHWTQHTALYALHMPVIRQFKKELEGKIANKGTIQLPHNEPLPLDLIKKLVQAQVKINEDHKLELKAKRSKK